MELVPDMLDDADQFHRIVEPDILNVVWREFLGSREFEFVGDHASRVISVCQLAATHYNIIRSTRMF